MVSLLLGQEERETRKGGVPFLPARVASHRTSEADRSPAEPKPGETRKNRRNTSTGKTAGRGAGGICLTHLRRILPWEVRTLAFCRILPWEVRTEQPFFANVDGLSRIKAPQVFFFFFFFFFFFKKKKKKLLEGEQKGTEP